MKIEGEEVVPVASFDELKPGVVIWIKPCSYCEKKHRCMIAGGAIHGDHGLGVPVAPDPPCKPASWVGRSLLYWENRNSPNVFRVVDGLPDQAHDEHIRRAIEHGAAGRAAVIKRVREDGLATEPTS